MWNPRFSTIYDAKFAFAKKGEEIYKKLYVITYPIFMHTLLLVVSSMKIYTNQKFIIRHLFIST